MKTKAKNYSSILTILKINKNTASIDGLLFLNSNNLTGELNFKPKTDASQSYLYSGFSNLMIAEIMDE